jgi:Uma2 family endonuclease
MTWLGVYCAATPGVHLADNATVRLDLDNEPQPDALLRLEPDKGGRSSITADDYIEGAPELIVEVAASSAAYDLHGKLQVYRRNGVQEYLVWQVYDRRVDWFQWTEDGYAALTPDSSGVIHSRMFPGLHLAVPALLQGDMAQVLATLQKGLGTAEHRTFVARLADSRRTEE